MRINIKRVIVCTVLYTLTASSVYGLTEREYIEIVSALKNNSIERNLVELKMLGEAMAALRAGKVDQAAENMRELGQQKMLLLYGYNNSLLTSGNKEDLRQFKWDYEQYVMGRERESIDDFLLKLNVDFLLKRQGIKK